MFNAIQIHNDEAGYRTELTQIDPAQLPEGDVQVAVEYSGLNYKDALAITGKGKIARRFPMVPGIDLAGTVTASSHAEFIVGDKVLLNGWGVGKATGVAWPNRPVSRATGSFHCRKPSPPDKPWPSGPPATPPCSASWHWNDTASVPTAAPYW